MVGASGRGLLSSRDWLALLLLFAVSACRGDGPADPGTPRLSVLAESGDGQVAPPGQALPLPLTVRVLDAQGGGQPSLAVSWDVTLGLGVSLRVLDVVTDAEGRARADVTLGPATGGVRVRVVVGSQAAEFNSEALPPAEVRSIQGDSVVPGEPITLFGRWFSAQASQNRVDFSGLPGRVVEATDTTLMVVPPACLPARDIEVRVGLGSTPGPAFHAPAADRGQAVALASGEDLTLDLGDCSRIAVRSGDRYALILAAGSSLAGVAHPYRLRSLARASSAPPVPGKRWAEPPLTPVSPLGHVNARGTEPNLEPWRRSWKERNSMAAGAAVAPPTLGDRRIFRVLGPVNAVDTVLAVVRYVGSRAVAYVDEAAPAGGLTDIEIAEILADFEDVSIPVVESSFAPASDIDNDQRVAILFTPTVNRLTPSGSGGLVGGFFLGRDLLVGSPLGNGAEILYAIVADPFGTVGPPVTRQVVLEGVPAVLAHELQHMVHFNARVLAERAPAAEAAWLSEALAHSAEESVAEEWERLGDADRAARFRRGNHSRARLFLESRTAQVSTLFTAGTGSLVERGAGWLFIRWMRTQAGGEELLGMLTQSTVFGVETVAAVSGRPWGDLLLDWGSALYLDDLVPDGPLTYPGVSLRTLFETASGSYALAPAVVGAAFTLEDSILSSAVHHLVLSVQNDDHIAVGLSEPRGAAAPNLGGLRLRVVRLP